jgi:hypothetical protein
MALQQELHGSHEYIWGDSSKRAAWLPGCMRARLQHGGRGQHDAGAHIVQVLRAAQLRDVLEVERVGHLRQETPHQMHTSAAC